MPVNGLICKWDVLRFGAAIDVTVLAGSNTWNAQAELLAISAINVTTTNADLSIVVTASESAHQVAVVGLGLGAGYLATGGSVTAKNVTVEYYDWTVYARAGTNNDIYATWSGAAIKVDGSTVATYGAGFRVGAGMGPQYIPFFGAAPLIAGSAQAGAKTGAVSPPTFTDTAEVTNEVSGGWQCEIGGVPLDLPVQIPTDLSIPAGAGPYGLGVGGIVVTTQTWGDHVVAYSFDEWERTATGTCGVDAMPGPGSNLKVSRAGAVFLLPNLTREFDRVNPTEYAQVMRRGGFPEVTAWRRRSWGVPLTIPPTPSTAGGESVEIASLPFRYFLAKETPHVAEQEAMPPDNIAPIEVVHSRALGENPLADPCDDFPLLAPAESETVTFIHNYRCQASTSGATDAQSVNADMIGTWDHLGSKDIRYSAFWGNPHWSFLNPPVPWELDGAPTPTEDYWYLKRDQWADVAGFNEADRHQTRIKLIWDILEDGEFAAWQDAQLGKGRFVGVSRFKVREATPLATYTYDAGDSALFSVDAGSLAHGADIAVTTAGLVTELYLDLGSYTAGPYQTPHEATHVTLDWTPDPALSVAAYVEGQDGTREEIETGASLKGIRLPLPRGGTSDYAGSWALDQGVGAIADTGADIPAGGISAATVADAERVAAFGLLPGSSRRRLVIVLTLSSPVTTLNVDYPVLEYDPPEPPVFVWESGTAGVRLWPLVNGEGGNAIRYGNLDHYDSGPGWLTPPVVSAPEFKPTTVDALAEIASWIEGTDRTAVVAGELAAMYDAVETQTLGAHDRGTYGVPLPGDEIGTLRFALISSPAEVPPVAYLPRLNRDADWQETGDPVQKALVFAQEPTKIVTPGSAPAHLADSMGAVLTSVDTTSPAGFTITSHRQAVTNAEDLDFNIVYEGTAYADVRPWTGWYCVLGAGLSGVAMDYAVSPGLVHALAYLVGDEVHIRIEGNNLAVIRDVATGITGVSDLCIQWANDGSSRLHLWTEEAGTIYRRSSPDVGKTWSMATSIGTGETPRARIGRNNVQYEFMLTGSGSTRDVVRRMYDAKDTLVEGPTTVYTGVDPGTLAVDESTKADGTHRLILWVGIGGTMTRIQSPDHGRTFS